MTENAAATLLGLLLGLVAFALVLAWGGAL